MTDEVHHFGGEVTDETVEDEGEPYQGKQIHVELVYIPWRDASRTDAENASILLTRTVIVNGHVMEFESDSPPEPVEIGKTYDLDQGEATIEAGMFMLIRLRRLTERSFGLLEVTAEDWMDGTDDQTLILPVSSLTIREASEDYYKERSSY